MCLYVFVCVWRVLWGKGMGGGEVGRCRQMREDARETWREERSEIEKAHLNVIIDITDCLVQLLMCGMGTYSLADFKIHHTVSAPSPSFNKVDLICISNDNDIETHRPRFVLATCSPHWELFPTHKLTCQGCYTGIAVRQFNHMTGMDTSAINFIRGEITFVLVYLLAKTIKQRRENTGVPQKTKKNNKILTLRLRKWYMLKLEISSPKHDLNSHSGIDDSHITWKATS